MSRYRRFFLRTALVAVPLLAAAALGAVPAAASPTAVGGITGQVTEVGGTPLVGVTVDVYTATPLRVLVTSTLSAANGTYGFHSLAAGSYYVCFDPGTGNDGGHSTDGYTFQCWLNKSFAQALDAVPVVAGQTTRRIGVALHANGGISGLVTDTNGVPLAGAVISINPTVSVQQTTTKADGTYQIMGVASQQTMVCVSGPISGVGGGPYGWSQKCWRNDPTYNNPVLILVKPGQVTPNINFRLGRSGALSGSVTNASGVPLAGVDITLHPLAIGGLDNTWTTLASGTFEFDDLWPGFYTVCATSGSKSACWKATVPGSATPVVVTETVLVRGINITLT